MRALAVLFFVSGMPALVYQIAWQRSLFSIYGINIESVTVVVTAFMLGLGIGSMVGGVLSRQRRMPRLMLFGVIEIAIGLFGLVSLPTFEWVAAGTAGGSSLVTGLATFGLLLVPTLLMGATLPILTAHLVERSRHVGKSVGLLYFANTLGSGVACFLAALVLMRLLGLSGSVLVAAIGNIVVGVVAIFFLGRSSDVDMSPEEAASQTASTSTTRRLGLPAAAVLAAWSGFLALAYEILWFRAFSYVSGGAAQCFAFLLGAYLVGLAFGSLWSRRLTKSEGRDNLHPIAGFALIANALGVLVVPLLAVFVTFLHYSAALPLVALAAAGLGGVFPLICHAALPPDARAGQGLSWLYMSNIVGAALGSFLTGYVLLDHFTLVEVSVGLAALGLAGCVLIWALGARDRARWIPIGSLAALGALLLAQGPLFGHLFERLHYKHKYDAQRYAQIVETRSGVVAVTQDNIIYGGGIYDGRFNTRLDRDVNGIFRLYSLSALHRAPKKVLMIGLGSGSWTQVVARHPQVESIDAIEINPGYLEVVSKSDVVRGILDDKKVTIHIDDGRRWLRSRPDVKFDAIVMNTTFHWRAHATGLLSEDFLRIAAGHLNPNGVIFYNTTSSPEVLVTGARTFKHALRIQSFLAVSDTPFPLDAEHWRQMLVRYQSPRPIPRATIDKTVALLETIGTPAQTGWHAMEDRASLLSRYADYPTITDDNMATEWHLRW